MSKEAVNKTKILLSAFEQIPGSTGAACWTAEEIRQLAQHFDVDVLSLKSENLSHIERYCGARLLRVPVGTGTFISKIKTFQRALTRQIESEDYKLCHFTSLWDGMVLASQKKNSGFKLVFEPQSLPSVDFKVAHPDEARQVETSYSLKQQEERCFSMADRIVVGSGLLREHIIRRGVSAKRIEVIPPAVDLAPFEKVATSAGQTGTLLYLGSLMPWQGVTSLLMAISELPRQIPARLLLVCPKDEPWYHEVLGKIQMLGLNKTVEILDPVPFEALPEVVARACVCIAPLANHEHNRSAAGIPHKILVYQACRRPVITARQPAIRGLVEHGGNGLLYPPGDVHELGEAIRKLVLDRELCSQLGNKGRHDLEESYSLPAATAKMLSVYRKLIGQPEAVHVKPASGEDTLPKLPVEGMPPPAPSALPEQPPLSATAQASFSKGTAGDTAPVFVDGAPPPDVPPRAPSTEDLDTGKTKPAETEPEEIAFSSVGNETSPPPPSSDADNWQVMEISQIQLPPEPVQAAKPARFLLGGPPFPVEQDLGEDKPIQKQPTQRDGTPLPGGELELLSDSEVQLVEGSDPHATPPPKRVKEK